MDKSGNIPKRFEDTISMEAGTVFSYDVGVLKEYFEHPAVIKLVQMMGVSEQTDAIAIAVLALGFTGRDIHLEDVDRLMESVGEKSDAQVKIFAQITHVIRIRSRRAYVFSFYFMKFMGATPNRDSLLEIVKCMGISPDANLADSTLKYCTDYMEGKNRAEGISVNTTDSLDKSFVRFIVIIRNFADVMGDFFLREAHRGIANVGENLRNDPELYAYVMVAGCFMMSGKDMYDKDLEAVLTIMNVIPRKELVNAVIGMHFRNKLTYAIMAEYLSYLGTEPTVANLINTVKAIDIIPDAVVAQQALDYYTERKAAKMSKP